MVLTTQRGGGAPALAEAAAGSVAIWDLLTHGRVNDEDERGEGEDEC